MKRQSNTAVFISKIEEEGIFGSSDLRVGQAVVSINGTPCPSSVRESVALIKGAEGEVTIVAASTVATIEKAEKETKVGVVLAKMWDCIIIDRTVNRLLFRKDDACA
jgi:C-terminal processing protease CtpA/Prc